MHVQNESSKKKKKCLKGPNRNNRAEEYNWHLNIQGFNSKLDQAEESICKLENRRVELI